MQMPVLDIGDCILRNIQKKDYIDLFEYARDEQVTKYVSWEPIKEIWEAKKIISDYYLIRPRKNMPVGYAIVYKTNNKMIGVIDFTALDGNLCGEIGYVLNRKYWNKGITTRALRKMVEVGFDILHLNRIEIRHVDENIASEHVIKNADFKYEGTLRKKYLDKKSHLFKDIKTYSILRTEYLKGELKWQL